MRHKLLFILIIVLINNMIILAQGNLLITPMRVIFEGNNQRAELTLINTGMDTTTYSISFRQYKMNEQGKFELIEKPETAQKFADPFLRIFPREITLAPGEPQTIMLQCRRKSDMLNGEYRSHLWFRSEKSYKELRKENRVIESNQLSVEVTPIFGITIPIIIRSGPIDVSTSFSNFKLDVLHDTIPILQFAINRVGNCSTYGDLIVEYTPSLGKPIQVGRLNRIAIYPEINQRKVSIKLDKVPGVIFKSGNLKLRYTSPDDSKYMVYAEAVLSLTEQPSIAQGATGEQGNNQKKEQ